MSLGSQFSMLGEVALAMALGALLGLEREGLTTAAAMLFSAAVGSAVGLRLFVLAVGATVLALITPRGLMYVEDRLLRRPPAPPPGG